MENVTDTLACCERLTDNILDMQYDYLAEFQLRQLYKTYKQLDKLLKQQIKNLDTIINQQTITS